MRLKPRLRAPTGNVDCFPTFAAVSGSAARRACMRARFTASGILAGVSLASVNAEAQLPTSSNRAMPGLVRVGVPVVAETPFAVGVGAGAGWLDQAQNSQAGIRLLGSAALAVNVAPSLQLGADLSGTRDNFGDEINGYGEPRLSARFVAPSNTRHAWGAELDARFVGGEAPSIEWSATSPSLRGLYGYRATEQLWVVGTLGLHLNRSAQAIPDVELIADNDRRSLMASTWSGVPWGLGLGYQARPGTNLSGELTGEWLIGDQAPPLLVSPIRLTAGVQQRLSENFAGFVAVEVGLSRRHALVAEQIWVEEPRLAGLLGFTWLLSKPQSAKPVVKRAPPPPPPPPVPPVVETPKELEPAVPPPAPIPVSPVGGTIVDEGGRPMADVEVVLQQEGQPPRSERTFADGRFEFREVPVGGVSLTVAEPGYDRVVVTLAPEQTSASEIVLRPAVPAGQVRGKVLDLQGNPVAAQVKVNGDGRSQTGTEQIITVAADGSFELDLVPGRYLVRFEHAEFAPQRRSIVVKNKGVIILNIALIR